MQDSSLIKITRWIVLGALFIIPFLALYVSDSLFFPFITGKNFAFRILVEIAFAGWILLMLADAKYRPRFSWTAAIFGLFVIWMAIADAFAVNPAKAFWSNFERMDGWVTLIHVFAFFLVTGSIFAADKLWRKWWLTFLSVSAIVCVYGFLQVGHVLAIHQGGVRLDATFGNSDYLACFMLFAIAVSLWQAFETKVTKGAFNWLRYLLLVLTVLEIIILFLTATRGAILGFIGAIGIGALLWMIESGKKGRQYAGLALVALVIVVGGFFLLRNEPFIIQDPTFGRLATISLHDPETDTRLVIWGMALQGFEQKPVTGWGQEGFNYVFNQYYKPVLNDQEPWFDRAHNMYLDWLVAGGFPALLLFLVLLGTAIYALYKSQVSRTERILLLSALAAYCFQGFFVFDNLFSYIPLAAVLAIAHGASSRPIKRLENVPVLGSSDLLTYAFPVTLVVLAVVLWMVNIPNMNAAGDLIAAITPSSDPTVNIAAFKKTYADGSFADQEITEQLITYAESVISSQTISTDNKQAFFTYTLQQANAIVTKIPKDARIRLQFALLYRSAGDYPDALTQIHIAEQLSPEKQNIIIEEGVEDVQSGNIAAGAAAFNKAYALDTTFADVGVYAAAGDIMNGQLATGKALLQKLYGTTAVDQDIVLLAYYQIKDYPDFIAVWQKRVADQNNAATAEFGLAAAYVNAGDVADAKAELQTILSQHPDQSTEVTAFLSQLQSFQATGK
jgi:O-antigen ligase/tetratricopeptide (TPR) repeat protein